MASPLPPFLRMPVELRVIIYKLVLVPEPFTFGEASKRPPPFQDNSVINVMLHGSLSERPPGPPHRHSPWALARVSRQVRSETAALLDAIPLESVHFSFYGFTPSDMSAWTRCMGPERLVKMRRWGVVTVNWCAGARLPLDNDPEFWGHPPSSIQATCSRDVDVNLNLCLHDCQNDSVFVSEIMWLDEVNARHGYHKCDRDQGHGSIHQGLWRVCFGKWSERVDQALYRLQGLALDFDYLDEPETLVPQPMELPGSLAGIRPHEMAGCLAELAAAVLGPFAHDDRDLTEFYAQGELVPDKA